MHPLMFSHKFSHSFSNNKQSFLLPLSFALYSLFISGCSLIKDDVSLSPSEQTTQQRTKQLEQLTQWKITGKIAFIEEDNRNSASLSWLVDEEKNTQQLNLTTYLGINVLQLNSQKNLHTIKADGKTYQGEDLQELVRSITNLTIPTEAMMHWLKGIAFKESDNINYHPTSNLPLTLSSYYNNEVWQISYANYQLINGYNLATKFTIKKEGLLIKIAINDWTLW